MREAPERPVLPAEVAGVELTIRTPSTEALGIAEEGLTQGQLAWRRFKRHRLAMVSAIVLVILAIMCALAHQISGHGFAELNLTHVLRGPRSSHPFGTDALGRDELARVLYGGRISLLVGLGVALTAAAGGTLVGAVSGFFGGRLDNFLMRVTDLFLAMPLLVILIIGSKLFKSSSPFDIVALLSLFFWMPVARIVRGVFLSLKEKEFVESARSVGASNGRIILRHILPNALGPIIVYVTLSVATAILAESALSFLGFGVQIPTATWGNLLKDARDQFQTSPWLVWFPGLFILVTVLAVNFLGDGLRDALDPTQQRVRA